MSKNVTFSLGLTNGLASRRLVIVKRREKVSSTTELLTAVAATYDQVLVGTTTHVTVSLDENTLFQATLVDTDNFGNVGRTDVVSFSTGNRQFPGPRSEGKLQVYAMEDESSSSSSSSMISSQSASSSSSSSSSSMVSSQSASSSFESP